MGNIVGNDPNAGHDKASIGTGRGIGNGKGLFVLSWKKELTATDATAILPDSYGGLSSVG
jgi:hypothetical protein